MKRILTGLTFLFISFMSFSQEGMNMTQLSLFYPTNQSPNHFSDVWGYAAPDGREYAIFGSGEGTYFVDVTVPQNPVEINYFPGGGSGLWRDFKTYRHYAIGVADVTAGNTLQIFDLQYLPDSVVKVYDSDQFSSNSHNIFVNNDRLYLISNTRGGAQYPLDILCIEDPENPYLIGGIRNGVNIPGFLSTHDAFVRNDTVYLSSASNGLQVFDMTDAENPVFIGSIENYPGKGYNHASWMGSDGTYMIMADETTDSPIKMLDITDLSNIQTVSTFAPVFPSMAHNPFIKDCLAFISYYHVGVQVYDVSNPSNPVQVAYFDTDTTTTDNYSPYASNWGVYPYLPSGNILATDQNKGLYVLSFDGLFPNCTSTGFDRVYEVDSTSYCEDTTTAPVAIQQNFYENIEVYPNPSKGLFHIISDENIINKISVYDVRGVMIHEKTISSYQRDITIDLNDKEDGIYFLHLQFNGGQKRLKIFKE